MANRIRPEITYFACSYSFIVWSLLLSSKILDSCINLDWLATLQYLVHHRLNMLDFFYDSSRFPIDNIQCMERMKWVDNRPNHLAHTIDKVISDYIFSLHYQPSSTYGELLSHWISCMAHFCLFPLSTCSVFLHFLPNTTFLFLTSPCKRYFVG